MASYIKSYIGLMKHYKILRLSILLDTKEVYILGHMHALWHTTLLNQEDGDITKWTAAEVARYAGYEERKPGEFLNALVDENVNFIDKVGGRLLIHDWLDIVGEYLTKKYRTNNPEKLKDIWELHGKILKTRSKQYKYKKLEDAKNDGELKKKLINIYPHLDWDAQFKKMETWLIGKPAKQDWERFVTKWFGNSRESGHVDESPASEMI